MLRADCPRCGSCEVYRSRSRGLVERTFKRFTARRLFRCESCAWRGWAMPMEPAVAGESTDNDFSADSLDRVANLDEA